MSKVMPFTTVYPNQFSSWRFRSFPVPSIEFLHNLFRFYNISLDSTVCAILINIWDIVVELKKNCDDLPWNNPI